MVISALPLPQSQDKVRPLDGTPSEGERNLLPLQPSPYVSVMLSVHVETMSSMVRTRAPAEKLLPCATERSVAVAEEPP